MWLTRVVPRRTGRIALVAGLGLAAAVPITLTVLAQRDDASAADVAPDRVVAFEAIAARSDAPTESFVLEAALPAPTQPAEEEPAPDAPPVPDPEPTITATPEPVAPAFAELPVMDPLSNQVVQPIAFAELPVAETPEIADDDFDLPLYVPGSIGAAKRGWAGSNGSPGTSKDGRGRIIVMTGGGHCPVPGRVPPYWKNLLL